MSNAQREAITGVWKQSPQGPAASRGRASGQGVRHEAPLKLRRAKFGRNMEYF